LRNCWSRGHHDVRLLCPEKDCACVVSDEDLAAELRATVKSKSITTNSETDESNSRDSYDNDLDSALTAEVSDGINMMQSNFSDAALDSGKFLTKLCGGVYQVLWTGNIPLVYNNLSGKE
jgi:hypothetical protein